MDSTWQGLIAGRSGIRRHPSLDRSFLQDIAGMVDDSRGTGRADPTLAKLAARFLQSPEAAREAWADAGLEHADGPLDPDRVAVAVGSAFGGVDLLEAQQARMRKRNDLSVSPFLAPGLMINQAAGQVSQHLGLYGPSVAPTNACARGATRSSWGRCT